jgi:hypothetical protein
MYHLRVYLRFKNVLEFLPSIHPSVKQIIEGTSLPTSRLIMPPRLLFDACVRTCIIIFMNVSRMSHLTQGSALSDTLISFQQHRIQTHLELQMMTLVVPQPAHSTSWHLNSPNGEACFQEICNGLKMTQLPFPHHNQQVGTINQSIQLYPRSDRVLGCLSLHQT